MFMAVPSDIGHGQEHTRVKLNTRKCEKENNKCISKYNKYNIKRIPEYKQVEKPWTACWFCALVDCILWVDLLNICFIFSKQFESPLSKKNYKYQYNL